MQTSCKDSPHLIPYRVLVHATFGEMPQLKSRLISSDAMRKQGPDVVQPCAMWWWWGGGEIAAS